ncbi:MAG: extracellular solute-binding protein [Clostridia bacterium]|nr:extracellular solute-binding protein [Clostridia bacterium]
MYKKITCAFIVVTLLVVSVCGCVDPSLPSPDDPVVLTMWHNYGGAMQQTMDELIDEFNSTVGMDNGITINVTAISSSADLNASLDMILNGDPGAPDMPDIFTGYPKTAVKLAAQGLLADLDDYFTDDELAQYVDAFVAEGRLHDGGLYVFPIAKSTEILYLNQTLFDEFASETGADPELLSSFEGIASLAQLYYRWTDVKTPDVPNDGMQFYTADSWFNVAEVCMEQLGGSFIDDENQLRCDTADFSRIFETLYAPCVEGGFAIYDGYSSDLSKTGDLVCSTGSSAGILFYGDTITYEDGTVIDVEYSILPYPVLEGGSNIALQRGGGLMVKGGDAKRAAASSIFIKWLTAAAQNMRFISQTGYIPVTKDAFEVEMAGHLDNLSDARIEKMLRAVLSMYESYDFFTAPVFNEFDALSDEYETDFKALMLQCRNAYLSGDPVEASAALTSLAE